MNEAEYGNFTLERRRTILKFPDEHRKKLDYFYRNWEVLVFPGSLKKRLLCLLSRTPAWTTLRATKRFAVQMRDVLRAFLGAKKNPAICLIWFRFVKNYFNLSAPNHIKIDVDGVEQNSLYRQSA